MEMRAVRLVWPAADKLLCSGLHYPRAKSNALVNNTSAPYRRIHRINPGRGTRPAAGKAQACACQPVRGSDIVDETSDQPFPPSEAVARQRLAALHATGLLDAPAEERFDRLTRL